MNRRKWIIVDASIGVLIMVVFGVGMLVEGLDLSIGALLGFHIFNESFWRSKDD